MGEVGRQMAVEGRGGALVAVGEHRVDRRRFDLVELARRLGDHRRAGDVAVEEAHLAEDGALVEREDLHGLHELRVLVEPLHLHRHLALGQVEERAVPRAVLDDQALCEALKGRLSELKARLERLDTRIQATRVVICEAMEEAGLTKITEPDFTLSLRTGVPPLMVIDEEAIPEPYWSPQPPKLERGVLKRALSDGKDIPGAVLGNGSPSISVRVR